MRTDTDKHTRTRFTRDIDRSIDRSMGARVGRRRRDETGKSPIDRTHR
jgi:hypothetical protein